MILSADPSCGPFRGPGRFPQTAVVQNRTTCAPGRRLAAHHYASYYPPALPFLLVLLHYNHSYHGRTQRPSGLGSSTVSCHQQRYVTSFWSTQTSHTKQHSSLDDGMGKLGDFLSNSDTIHCLWVESSIISVQDRQSNSLKPVVCPSVRRSVRWSVLWSVCLLPKSPLGPNGTSVAAEGCSPPQKLESSWCLFRYNG